MKNGEIPKSYTNYEIREIKEEDIDNGGLLEVYRENFPLGDLPKAAAKAILKEIKTNPLHKIFVAVTNDNHDWVIGTTSLLVEPKFKEVFDRLLRSSIILWRT
jgi:glucosamine-phosphate N-acetyltransferase